MEADHSRDSMPLVFQQKGTIHLTRLKFAQECCFCGIPEQTDTRETNVTLNETCNQIKRRGAKRSEQRQQSDGWLVTRLPARAELTLVDPFSCTEMEGTLQDRKQGQRRSVRKSSSKNQPHGKTTTSLSGPLCRIRTFCYG